MHVEAGHLLGQLRRSRRSRARAGVVDHVAQPVEPPAAMRNERISYPAATARRTTFSPSAMKRPSAGLEALPQLHVAQRQCSRQPRIGGVPTADQLGHGFQTPVRDSTTSPMTTRRWRAHALPRRRRPPTPSSVENTVSWRVERAVLHDGGRRPGRLAVPHECRGDRAEVLDGHQQHEGAGHPSDGRQSTRDRGRPAPDGR